uniref:Uncharacterized protein n=1 Tax=Dictyoglomus thermophilum TaxID=14 RepID=A0A7C3RKW6_DICTH
MKFKSLVILSLVIHSVFSLAYAYGPKFGGYMANVNIQLTKISGTVSKITNTPALTVTIKTVSGDKEVILGPAWLQIKDLKVGSKIEVEGFVSPVTNVFKAVKASVDGKEVLNLQNSPWNNIVRGGRRGFQNYQNCPCLNLKTN